LDTNESEVGENVQEEEEEVMGTSENEIDESAEVEEETADTSDSESDESSESEIFDVSYFEGCWEENEDEQMQGRLIGDVSQGKVISELKCIAFNSVLIDIVKRAIGSKCSKCRSVLNFSSIMRGTALVLTWKCLAHPASHCGSWSSQPRFGGTYACNLLLPSSLLISGNSYCKVALMASFMNLGFVTEANFYRLVDMLAKIFSYIFYDYSFQILFFVYIKVLK